MTYELVRDAILNRKIIVCIAKGFRRELCPHVLGEGKDGHPMMLGYQFAGGSSRGLPLGGEWRCFHLSEMSGVEIRNGAWHTGNSHKRPQTCVKRIDVEVR